MLIHHLPFTQIADIAEGRLTLDQAARSHLDSCAACAADLAWLARTIDLLHSAAGEEQPPASAVARVKARFRQQRAQPSLAPRLIRSLLRFDSISSRPAFGLRAGAATERQLLFSADNYEIDLRITPQGDRWAISGQILSDDPTPLQGNMVEIMGPSQSRTEMNELNEFSLPPVAAGHYELTIHFDEFAIVIPDLEPGT